MSKTIDGKFIFTHKGEDYVPLEDYVKLLQEKEDLKEKVILLRASEPMLELEKYYGDRDKYKEVIEEVREYNNQIIKDTKDFYRPTEDKIYSGDTLIDLAETNIQILDKAKKI